MPINYTSIDQDLLLAGVEGYRKPENSNGRTPIYKLEKGTTTVYFLTDPWNAQGVGDWFAYREVSAFDGLRGGFQLPNGIKEFPVNDQMVVVDPNTGERTRQYAPRGTDPLLELVMPSSMFPPADGRPKGNDRMVINVLNEEGNHIVLKLTGARAQELLRQVNGFRKVDPNFSMTKYPWQLTLSGTGVNSSLTLDPLMNQPPAELPDPHNLAEVIADVRARVEEFVNSLRGDAVEEDVLDSSDEVVDIFEEAVVESNDVRDYSAVSDVRLKTLLANAKKTNPSIVIPPRATRQQLITLAETYNV